MGLGFLSVGSVGQNERDAIITVPPHSFNPQCITGENESILIGLKAALGLGLVRFLLLGLN